MAIQADYQINRSDDTIVNVSLAPPVPISGWTIQFQVILREGGVSPLLTEYIASGFTNGQSGGYLVNGAIGTFYFNIPGNITGGVASGISGISNPWNFDTYNHSIYRLDSGFHSCLVIGNLLVPQ